MSSYFSEKFKGQNNLELPKLKGHKMVNDSSQVWVRYRKFNQKYE